MYRWITTVARSGVSTGVAPPPPPPPPSGGPISLSAIAGWTAPNGNSSHLAWTTDSTRIVQANEESNSGFGTEVVINASQPSALTINEMFHFMQYEWAVATSGDFAVWASSGPGWITGVTLSTGAKLWQVFPFSGTNNAGMTGDLATDGTYVYAANSADLGGLLVLSAATGATVALVNSTDPWGRAYTVKLTTFGGHSYCFINADSSSSTSPAAAGGIYCFDVTTPTAPTYVGRVMSPGMDDFVLNGHLMYLFAHTSAPDAGARDTIQVWDVTTPTAPVHLAGDYVAPTMSDPSFSSPTYVTFIRMCLNPAGTRLYASYNSVNATGGQTLNAPAGWVIFALDANGENPTPLASQTSGSASGNQLRGQWVFNNGFWTQLGPDIQVSPDATKIAVSYWALGVAVWALNGDSPSQAPNGILATTGETRDGWADTTYLYLAANDDFQVVRAGANGETAAVIPNYAQGGIRAFRDGRYVVWDNPYQGYGFAVLDFSLGPSGFVYQSIGDDVASAWDARYDATAGILYVAGPNGLDALSITASGSPVSYAASHLWNLGSLSLNGLSAPFTGSDGNRYIAAVGVGHGVYVIQLTGTGAPAVVFSDTTAFSRTTSYGTSGTNGNFASAEVIGSYLYATCHHSGLQIYQIGAGPTFSYLTMVNLTPTWIDAVNQDLLILKSYWGGPGSGPVPDGVYILDLRTNPTAPTIYTNPTTPVVADNGWRARYWAPYVLELGLGGGALFQLVGYP